MRCLYCIVNKFSPQLVYYFSTVYFIRLVLKLQNNFHSAGKINITLEKSYTRLVMVKVDTGGGYVSSELHM